MRTTSTVTFALLLVTLLAAPLAAASPGIIDSVKECRHDVTSANRTRIEACVASLTSGSCIIIVPVVPGPPGTSNVVGGQTIVVPGRTITTPPQSHTTPEVSRTIPSQTVTIPLLEETVTTPEQTVTVPSQTVRVPSQTVTVPSQTVSVPAVPVETPGGPYELGSSETCIG